MRTASRTHSVTTSDADRYPSSGRSSTSARRRSTRGRGTETLEYRTTMGAPRPFRGISVSVANLQVRLDPGQDMHAWTALGLALLALAPVAEAQAPSTTPTAPYGFHLGLSTDASSLVLQWFTRGDGPTHVDVTTAAGAEAGSYDGSSELIPEGGGVYVHSTELKGLVPGTYVFAVDGSEPTEFRVPGGPSARLAFVGDQGVRPEAAAVTELIGEQVPDAVFHAGDISYAEGNPKTWDDWFLQTEPVASTVPWLPAVGNHETYYLAPLQEFLPLEGRPNPEVDETLARFALPNDEMFWSWDVGPVHVVAMDTFYTGFEQAPAGAEWIAADLAAHRDAPWTIVFLHDPMFSSGPHGSNEGLREVLLPLLEAGGVDLVVAAHDHIFERSWPLDGETPVTTAAPFSRGAGIIHLVTGGGGAGLYELSPSQPPWSATRASEHHAFFVEANATHLTGTAMRPDGTVLDTFSIEAPAEVAGGRPPPTPTPGPAFVVLLAGVGLVALARRAFNARRW